MQFHRLTPRGAMPDLDLPLAGGGRFNLRAEPIDRFLLIDAYRGHHCPRCRAHLMDLHAKLPHFRRRGVNAVALSMDTRERAEASKSEWLLNDLRLAYGLSASRVGDIGLFLSDAINEREARRFCEPGTFLVAPDYTLYMAIYNTTPFARFHFADLLEGIETIISRDYPPRGDAAIDMP